MRENSLILWFEGGGTDRVGAHGFGVRRQRQEGEAAEQHAVEEAVRRAPGRQQHDEHDHELGVEDQEPGDDGAGDAAAVADEPHGPGAAAGWGRDAVLRLQVASLPLDVPGALRRTHPPTASAAASACCRRHRKEALNHQAGKKRTLELH